MGIWGIYNLCHIELSIKGITEFFTILKYVWNIWEFSILKKNCVTVTGRSVLASDAQPSASVIICVQSSLVRKFNVIAGQQDRVWSMEEAHCLKIFIRNISAFLRK